MSNFDAGPIRGNLAVGRVRATEMLPVSRGEVQAELKAPTSDVRSQSLDPGLPPVDAERVATIRKAIEDGRYPLVPHRVADAMVAAGLLLRTEK